MSALGPDTRIGENVDLKADGVKALVVSVRVYRALWLAVIAVWFLNGLLSGLFAAVYYVGLTTNDGYPLESAGLLSLRYIPLVIAVYSTVAFYNWLLLSRAVIASLRFKSLVFSLPRSKNNVTSRSRCTSPALQCAGVLLRCFTGHRGDPAASFEIYFMLRELLEIATQTYQAYKCSILISQRWINHVFISILAINCWAAPLIHSLVSKNPPLKRCLYLASDVVLDFASTFIIPVCIITSVIGAALVDQVNLTNNTEEYAFDVPYDDVFLTNLIRGAQQVCVVSLLDFATKMMPFISMSSCLGQITELTSPYRVNQIRPVDIAPGSSRHKMRHNGPTIRRTFATPHRHWRSVIHLTHAIFVFWGLGIVFSHLRAQSVSDSTSPERNAGCKSSARPWFVNKYSCTTLEINCFRRNISGSAPEIAMLLDDFDLEGLGSLIITHCPSLEMPAAITKLHSLLGLEITNATLVAWDQQAALTTPDHPALKFLTLVRVNMTSIPAGLQAPNFPLSVTDIAIVESNITTRGFPDDLDTKWAQVFNLYIERTALTSIPRPVAQLRVNRLSLFMNNITTISAETIAGNRFNVLSFARNPVTEWPDTIGDVDRLTLILVDYTGISSLPVWLVEEGRRRGSMGTKITISAGGTPYCRTVAGPAMDDIIFEGLQVICREKPDRAIQAYPMAFNSINRIP